MITRTTPTSSGATTPQQPELSGDGGANGAVGSPNVSAVARNRDTGGDAALRGNPSAVWRFGQDRRFDMIGRAANLEGADTLDLGCGLGMYTQHMADSGARALGLEIEWPRALEARQAGLDVMVAVGEFLPLPDRSLDVILLHEVLEHVADDRATLSEVARVLRPGGRAIIFVPNRLWPFETHGVMWRGSYKFGNAPFVNWLPDIFRNRIAPHVRVYTTGRLRSRLYGLPLIIVSHTFVFPGFDSLGARRPRLARLLRAMLYPLERTPLRRFGLSHLLVVERIADDRG